MRKSHRRTPQGFGGEVLLQRRGDIATAALQPDRLQQAPERIRRALVKVDVGRTRLPGLSEPLLEAL
jgi:hypothetical protein